MIKYKEVTNEHVGINKCFIAINICSVGKYNANFKKEKK